MSDKVDTAMNSLLPTLLLVLFVGLKLTGYITWSWWWVLAPLWIPIGIVLGCMLVLGGTWLFLARKFGVRIVAKTEENK